VPAILGNKIREQQKKAFKKENGGKETFAISRTQENRSVAHRETADRKMRGSILFVIQPGIKKPKGSTLEMRSPAGKE